MGAHVLVILNWVIQFSAQGWFANFDWYHGQRVSIIQSCLEVFYTHLWCGHYSDDTCSIWSCWCWVGLGFFGAKG